MFEKLKELLPWLADLQTIPKIIVSIIGVLILFFFLTIIWSPSKKQKPNEAETVVKAYNRMLKVLNKLTQDAKGQIYVDNLPIDMKLADYYSNYLAIADYIKDNPNNIEGAYEKIWEYGGQGRTFINDTQIFETVVSAFFIEYERNKISRE